MNELTYDAWLTQGNKYKQKYYLFQSIALMVWAATTAVCVMGMHYGILASLMLGFLPYFVFYLVSLSFYEKWQNCEDKYNHHVPFIDVKKLNVLLTALEFQPGEVIAHYMKYDGRVESMSLPADKVQILPAEEDCDSMQLRKDFNNFTQKEEWKYIRIYLTPKMQEKLVALTH